MTFDEWKPPPYQPVTWQQIWDAATLAERNRLWDEAEQRAGLPDSDRHGAQAYELGRQDGMRAERERCAKVVENWKPPPPSSDTRIEKSVALATAYRVAERLGLKFIAIAIRSGKEADRVE